MKSLSCAPLFLLFHAFLCIPIHASAANIPTGLKAQSESSKVAVWKSTRAEHLYGFPDMKPNKKGTLTLDADTLTFTGRSGNTSIQRSSVTAVSAGNQRVELWGMKGRLLRMAIPDGGGIAAASFMHHRVDILTVEFYDSRGSDHGAVFFLPANEAERALQSFAETPVVPRIASDAICKNSPVEPKSVLVSAPIWDNMAVPAAYRALVYEHVIDRLQRTKDVGHVYREGENNGHGACPQYTVHISITTFKEGSSVKRAFLGPAGMFVGTTQMGFDTTLTDASGKLNIRDQVKAAIRGESESTNVADKVGKTLAKHYSSALKNAGKSKAL